MKIVMIGHKRIPSREGGVEIVVEELSTRLAKMGHKVTVYNRKGKNVADKNADLDVHKLKEYKEVRIVRIPTSQRKSLNALIYSFNATICAIFGNYDVIHYHAEGPCAMLILPHILGIRTVATIHGLDWQRSKWGGFATKYLKFGEKIAAKYADELIVLSRNVQQYFLDTYHRQTVYIPNGVNKPDILPADVINKKYGLEKDCYILFLARLVPEKGIHYLLEAFSRIDTDIKLVIAGGGSHSSDYVQQIQEAAAKDSRVIMTGFVQGTELQELFSNCYLYILPSDIEGMPISLLEAMSYGCRCVASNIAENSEACQDYAVYFEKSNVDDLQRVLTECIKNPDLFKKREDIIQYCTKQFNWDKVTDASMKLYIDSILNTERIKNV